MYYARGRSMSHKSKQRFKDINNKHKKDYISRSRTIYVKTMVRKDIEFIEPSRSSLGLFIRFFVLILDPHNKITIADIICVRNIYYAQTNILRSD